jgi:hypothetical protein
MKKYLLLIFFVSIICFSNNANAQRYLIIISSTTSKSVAENEVEKLQASGFVNAGMVYQNKTKSYRVFLNSFDSKELAQDEAEKYKAKYKDSWVFKSKDSDIKSPIKDETLDAIRKQLSNDKAKFDSIQKDITSIKEEIKSINNYIADNETSKILEDKIKSLNDHIDNIVKANIKKDQEIKALNETLNKIGSDYVKRSDTISYSWKLARRKFDFGNPRFYFALGLTQSNLFSTIDSLTQSYYNINTINTTKSFFGFNVTGGVNISPKWSTELNLKSYITGNDFYLFPSLDFKFSQQLGKLPIKINPLLAIGSEVLILQNSTIKAGRYIFYSPGLELQIGLSKRFSIFAKGKYNFISQFQNNQYSFNKVRGLDLTYGIRFNFIRKK